jgi:hypothetical protein
MRENEVSGILKRLGENRKAYRILMRRGKKVRDSVKVLELYVRVT